MNAMRDVPLSDRIPELWRRRGPLAFLLLFWAVEFGSLSLNRWLTEAGDDVSYILPRLAVATVGLVLSLIIAEAHRRLIGRRLRVRMVAAIVFALAGCCVHAGCNFIIFQIAMAAKNLEAFSVQSYFSAVLQWFWSYSALSGLLLAFIYASELNTLQRVTHTAQIRALRYQLNPHFMFNTLNSIAALIARGDPAAAERMVEDLSDFLRATLSLDANDDIVLGREIHLQSLYLAIESLRFGDRFRVEIDISDEARRALVPSLITQPLAENVIRHAVAHSIRPIDFRIAARREGSRLLLEAVNSGPDSPARASSGTGIGLGNVAERLRARYGTDCSFTAEHLTDDGFRVAFSIPFHAGADA
jgi:two-component system LytT family sensor kinase